MLGRRCLVHSVWATSGALTTIVFKRSAANAKYRRMAQSTTHTIHVVNSQHESYQTCRKANEMLNPKIRVSDTAVHCSRCAYKCGIEVFASRPKTWVCIVVHQILTLARTSQTGKGTREDFVLERTEVPELVRSILLFIPSTG